MINPFFSDYPPLRCVTIAVVELLSWTFSFYFLVKTIYIRDHRAVFLRQTCEIVRVVRKLHVFRMSRNCRAICKTIAKL